MADTKNKKVVLKYRISGGYYVNDGNGPEGGSSHHDYPDPMEEVALPEDVADSLLANGNAWTPSEFKKVTEKA